MNTATEPLKQDDYGKFSEKNHAPAKCNIVCLDELRARMAAEHEMWNDFVNGDGKFDPELVDLPSAALEELKSIDQWVSWKYVKRGTGKPTKPPVDPNTGRGASHSNPAHWASFEKAEWCSKKNNLAGVGFVLSENDDYTGVDLDNCRDSISGRIDPWVSDILDLQETYAEVSPSGTGIRMFVRGKVEKSTKCDKAGIEIYGSQRYMTVTGHHIDDTPEDIRPAPKTLAALLARVEMFRPKDAPEPKAPAAASAPLEQHSSSDAGAQAWAKRALEGKAAKLAGTEVHRNHALNASAYGMGTMAARGWITEAECFAALMDACKQNGVYKEDGPRQCRASFLSGFRRGLQNPHDDLPEREENREIETLAAEIGRMVDEAYQQGEEVGTDAEPDPAEEGQEVDAEPAGPDFADAILDRHGLVSEIAHWILSVSRRPQKRFAVASALAVVATAASRQLQTPTFANVNLFITMIGQSGSGKDAPMKATTELLMKSSLPDLIGPDGFQSETAVYDKIQQHPVCLAAVNEFGDYLAAATAKHAPSHISKVLAVLRKMYDGGTISSPHAAGRHSVCLNNPCLSILGAATPKQFYGAIGDAQAENGTLNRFIAVTAPGHVKKADTYASTSDVPVELREWLLALADRPGGVTSFRFRVPEDNQDENGPLFTAEDLKPHVVPWTDDAKELWNAYEDEVTLRMAANPHIDNFAARCAQNALRVATVLAVGENIVEPMVEPIHIEIGKSMVEASLRDMMRGFDEHGEETPESRLANRIKRIIASKGGVIGRSVLMRSLRRHIRNEKSLDDALKVLNEAGEIIVDKGKTGEKVGRPGVKYRLRR